MARQLNYAKRAIVPVPPKKYDILPFQYQQPTSRQINSQILKENRVNYIVQEYRKNSHLFNSSSVFVLNSKPPSSGKLKDGAKRNNIDYLYKFVDIIEQDFYTLLEDSHLTHRSLKYLQTDVQTIFTVEHYKTLRKLGVLPNKDVLIGRKPFADAVEKSIYHLKLLHTDCELAIKRVVPIPEKLQVEIRYTFRGMTRLPKNEVIIDFIVKFNFSKASKQVHLIEFTDKHVKYDKSYIDVLKTLGVMAMPLFGLSDNIGLLDGNLLDGYLSDGGLLDCGLLDENFNLEKFDFEQFELDNFYFENFDEYAKNKDVVTLEQLVNPIYVQSD